MPALKWGDRVLIQDKRKYGGALYGLIGTIRSSYFQGYQGECGVLVDGRSNPKSSYGIYYIPASKLRPCQGNETVIEQEENIMLKGYRVAIVEFPGSPRIAYALYDSDVSVGDTVVVSTGHHGLSIATIQEILPEGANQKVECNRQIVDRVDLSAWEERKQKAKELAKLKTEMDQRVKDLQEIALYEMAAERDPALKEMLEQFKKLSGAQ